MEIGEENLERFLSLIGPPLDERERRLMAAAAAEMIGRGGQAAVERRPTSVRALFGRSRSTFVLGCTETSTALPHRRVRVELRAPIPRPLSIACARCEPP